MPAASGFDAGEKAIATHSASPQISSKALDAGRSRAANAMSKTLDAGHNAPSDESGNDAGEQQSKPSTPARRKPTAPRLKLAFFGDQGVGAAARRVLALVASEHADAVIHLGDFAYDEASPSGWATQIDSVLGASFPYFAVIGNHDVSAWSGSSGFAARLLERMKHIPDAHCEGEYGVDASCSFRGLAFVLSGVGTYGKNHESFLDTALSKSDAAFRLCIWHKNQHDTQVGSKTDEVGWEAYQICARHGVPVINGHEHSYARSQVLSAIGSRDQQHGALGDMARLELAPGRTFVVVSGLGGESMRARTADHASDTWWASIYAQNYQFELGTLQSTAPTIQYGALFIEFYVDDDPYKARGYFKSVDGQTHDEFTLVVPVDGDGFPQVSN